MTHNARTRRRGDRRVTALPGTLKRFVCQTPDKAKWYVSDWGFFHCDQCYAHCGTTHPAGFEYQAELIQVPA